MSRLAAILKVRPGEGYLVILVTLLFAFLQAGQGLGENAASALFLLRYGVDFLPYMYIAAGILTFFLTLAYSAGLGRFEKGRFFLWMIAVFVVLLIFERAAILLDYPFLYPLLWLTITGISGILGTLVWNLAGEVCDARQAKRLFPLFTSAGILGSVAGNIVTGISAKQLGTENLFILYAGLLGAAFYLTRRISGSYFQKGNTLLNKTSFWDDLLAGYDFVRTSPLMRLIAIASILFSVLYFTIAFPFSKVITASFPDEAGVAGFFGLFNSITTATTFLVSLLIANRIYTRLGIINGVFLMPLTYIFCFAVFGIRFDMTGATIARFAQLVILGGVAGTAWNALFNVVPTQKRGQVLAFNNGVPSQIGVVLSGVLLIVADQALTVQQIFIMGIMFAMVCSVVVWRMRAAYAHALVEALRAGRLEVFSERETAFSGFQGEATALNVTIQALQDPKATTRQLAAVILGKIEAAAAIPVLTRSLSDPNPEVRAAAIASLGTLRAKSGLEPIIDQLDDPDEQVRVQVLMALPLLEPAFSSTLIEKLRSITERDLSIRVQMQAVVTLAKLGAGERTSPKLLAWLQSKDSQIRISALTTVKQIAPYLTRSFSIQPLLDALEDPSASIRRIAALALVNFEDSSISRALITRLGDADEAVRTAAAEALRQRGDESQKLVVELFATDNPALDSALDAIVPGNKETLTPLLQFAEREIFQARNLQNVLASLPVTGRYTRFLSDQVRNQIARYEGRLIKTIGLFGDRQTMELVRKSMNSAHTENRAAAIEALDTIGDKQLAKSIVKLLEEVPLQFDITTAIDTLLKSSDQWLRILAICAIPELGLHEFKSALHEFLSESNTLIREAAQRSLSQFGEASAMNTLQTVSLLERILLLREIPIFADLSPEDLEIVAKNTQEEWFPQNTDIFYQGDEGNRMFVIVDGQVQVVRNREGQDQIVAERGPGEFVGEMAIIESAPRVATLRTQSEVRVLAIDDKTFKGILRERPDVSFAVLRSISRRLREMTV